MICLVACVMVLAAPSPELADVLRGLAQRIGYAVRKAKPTLDEQHKVRLLVPLLEVLDDLSIELKAGKLQSAPSFVKKEVELLSALAGASHGLPPPPPPPLDSPATGIWAHDLEEKFATIGNSTKYVVVVVPSFHGADIAAHRYHDVQAELQHGSNYCCWCGIWQPFVPSTRRHDVFNADLGGSSVAVALDCATASSTDQDGSSTDIFAGSNRNRGVDPTAEVGPNHCYIGDSNGDVLSNFRMKRYSFRREDAIGDGGAVPYDCKQQ